MNKLISICLASYNGEKYLKEQLDSLVEQTYKNMEIIIQDDCSSDNSVQIISSYNDILDIKLIINDKNIGYIKNFESTLKRATGEYIAICDQDDIWEKDKLQILIDNIENNSLIYSDSLLIDENANSINKTLSKKLKNNFINSNNALNFLYDNCVSAHAMLFNKELLKYIFPFPKYIYFDQWIAANAADLNGVKYIDIPLIKYRQHSSNTLGNKSKNQDSFKVKIDKKIDKKIDANSQMLKNVIEFQELKPLAKTNQAILKQLENFYSDFDNSYYNFRMFLLLKKNQNSFFKITKKNNLILILKKPIGLELYKLAPIL